MDRPILFSAPMVRAILGTPKVIASASPEEASRILKTQTRRIVKLPADRRGAWEPTTIGGPDGGHDSKGRTVPERTAIWNTTTGKIIGARYAPGDRLYVRETWRPAISHSHGMDACDCADVTVTYAADGEVRFFPDDAANGDWTMPQAAKRGNVPGIHMPRWASRITLEVTGVRVERLQAISEHDAKAEGLQWAPDETGGNTYGLNDVPGSWQPTARAAFEVLWRSINGDEAWDANPWVWVVSFERVEPSARSAA